MGHHHDHDHDDHHHDHGHNHGHDEAPQPGVEAKLARLLGHWANHNHEHAQSYRQWAEQARGAGRNGIADLLDAVAEQTLRIAAQLEGGLTSMGQKR